MTAHRRESFQRTHRTRIRLPLTFGGRTLWRYVLSLMCSNRDFSLDVVLLFIPMVIIDLTVVQREVAAVFKSFIHSPVMVPVGAVFFVVDSASVVVDREQHLNICSCRWTLGFDWGRLWAHWGGLEERHLGICCSYSIRGSLHFLLIAMAFHDGFLTVNHTHWSM